MIKSVELLEAELAVLAKYGVSHATFMGDGLSSVTFHPPGPPPFVVAPGDKDDATREPDGVELAALKLQGRGRRPAAQGLEST